MSAATENAATIAGAGPAHGSLKRSLTLWNLILYGVIVIQPTAPMSVFGVLSDRGHGHVVTTILLAMVAMLFTAISYGRMARAYPSAGSAFTYVGREINPALGFVTGWSMVMDYMLTPMICRHLISHQAHDFAPGVPYAAWAILFAALITWLNTRGIQSSARINSGLAIVMGLVIAIFFVAAARIIFGHPHEDPAFFTRPFYDPETWNTKAVLGGTSIAVLTYIGFDGISTLSEEAENPRRNILFATVLTCLVIGILSAFEVYAAQLVWPASTPFPDVDTAFVHVAGHAWAPLFAIVGFTLVVANFGSGLGFPARSRAPALWHGAQQRFAKVVLRRLAPEDSRAPEQRALRWSGRAHWRILHRLRPRSGDAQLRRAHRLHGRQRGRDPALLRTRVGEEAHEPRPSPHRVLDMPASLAEPEPPRQNSRRHLDGGGDRLRGVENERLSRRARRLRAAARRGLSNGRDTALMARRAHRA